LRSILAGHGLDRYFEGMIISSEVGASKPDERIFRAALALAKASPEVCLHLGDERAADVAGAQAVGMAAQQVNRPEASLLVLAEKLRDS
jgi:putative hydrolase of the HAD superfamily